MKLVGIGDKFIPSEYIMSGFGSLEKYGVEVKTVEWVLRDFDELQRINLLIEQNGSDAEEPPEYIYEAVKDADIIITQFCPITRKLIDSCRNLKYIGVLRGGYENVNIKYASEKGITVFNTPGRNADSVSDFTVGVMICEARNIARGHYGLMHGEWIREYSNSDYIPDLPGRTVGIIGFGEIGQKVAKKLSGFDMKIKVYDPFLKNKDLLNTFGAEETNLDTLLKESDFVTVHARLTAENAGMIDKEKLALMKKTAYLINTSRSGLIVENDLYNALRDNIIAGAAIDVFDSEPLGKDYPLLSLPNITVTPHMAGGSKDAFYNTPKKLAADMEQIFTDGISCCKYTVNK